MKADIWYPHYVGDYHRDTMHLSTLEHGAYRLLMDAYWINQGPLPDDDRKLSNIVKLSLSDWSAIRSTIASFFQITDEEPRLWIHKRIDFELSKALKQKKSKSLAAYNTNKKRWGNRSLSESLSESQKGRSSPSPSPKSLCVQGDEKSDARVGELLGKVFVLYGRKETEKPNFEEEHHAAEIIRNRLEYLTEFEALSAFKAKAKRFPESSVAMLAQWAKQLDRSRNQPKEDNGQRKTVVGDAVNGF